MKKRFFQHKKFAPAILAAIIAVSFGASTAMAHPLGHEHYTPNDPPCVAGDQCFYEDRGTSFHDRYEDSDFQNKFAAKYLAESFSLDREVVHSYLDDGWRFRSLQHAALIAKVSGTPFETVLETKDSGRSWREVAAIYNVTPSQIKEARFDIRAAHMAERLDMNKHTLKTLLKDGYHPRDIAAANAIAKKSNKPLLTVLSLRGINNTWEDVAEEVGLSPRETKKLFAPHQPPFPRHR